MNDHLFQQAKNHKSEANKWMRLHTERCLERDGLRQQLKKYGRHLPSCRVSAIVIYKEGGDPNGGFPCTCGFDDAKVGGE